jgi:hypothetical protein
VFRSGCGRAEFDLQLLDRFARRNGNCHLRHGKVRPSGLWLIRELDLEAIRLVHISLVVAAQLRVRRDRGVCGVGCRWNGFVIRRIRLNSGCCAGKRTREPACRFAQVFGSCGKWRGLGVGAKTVERVDTAAPRIRYSGTVPVVGKKPSRRAGQRRQQEEPDARERMVRHVR